MQLQNNIPPLLEKSLSLPQGERLKPMHDTANKIDIINVKISYANIDIISIQFNFTKITYAG